MATEDPLAESPDQHGMRDVENRTVEPEMHAGNRGRVEFGDSGEIGVLCKHVGKQVEHPVPGDCEDELVGVDHFTRAQSNSGDATVLLRQPGDAGTGGERDASGGEPVAETLAVQLVEGNRGDPDPPAFPVCQKPLDKDLTRMRHADAVGGFAQGTDEKHVPELPAEVCRSGVLLQPLLEGEALVDRPAMVGEAGDVAHQHPPLRRREPRQAVEGLRQMKGSGAETIAKAAALAAGADEEQFLLRAKEIVDSHQPCEVIQVRAAAHADVLTGIDPLAGFAIEEGAGAAAEPGPRFEQCCGDAGGCQSCGGGESGESSTDDDDASVHPAGILRQRNGLPRRHGPEAVYCIPVRNARRPVAATLRASLRGLGRDVRELIYPSACLCCRGALRSESNAIDDVSDRHGFCETCHGLLRCRIAHACLACGAPVGPYLSGWGCRYCRNDEFAFDRVLSLGVYEGELKRCCLRAKQAVGGPLTAGLAGLLWETYDHVLRDAEADVVLGVPHHWRDRIRLGHLPPQTMAEVLGRRLSIRAGGHILAKRRRTPAQASLQPARRRTNLKDAFVVTGRARLNGLTVLLVDDILTTGTTADRVSRALREAGAVRIVVAVLARGLG
jgi:predicted amidophosphoribosyltransferase